MRCLGRIIAFFLLMLVVFMIPCSIWTLAFWQLGTDPTTYTETLDEAVYEGFSPFIIPFLAQEAEAQTNSQNIVVLMNIIENTNSEEWDNISSEIVSPEWLQEEMGRNMTIALDYFHGDSDNFDLVIDARPIRDKLSGQSGQELVDSLMAQIEGWDQCSPAQVELMIAFNNGATDTMPKCRPPSEAGMQEIRTGLENGITEILDRLPEDGNFVIRDEILASDPNTTPEEYSVNVKETRRFFIMMDNSIPASIFIPIMFMGLIVLFAVRTAKDFFLWMGLPLMLAGFFTIFPAVTSLYTLTQPLQLSGNSALQDLGSQAIFEVTRTTAGKITGPILAITFFLVLTGFIFLVLAGILKGPKEAPTQYYYVPTSSSGSTPSFMPQAGFQSAPHMGGSPVTPSPAPIMNQPMVDDNTTATPPPQINEKADAEFSDEDINTIIDTPPSTDL